MRGHRAPSLERDIEVLDHTLAALGVEVAPLPPAPDLCPMCLQDNWQPRSSYDPDNGYHSWMACGHCGARKKEPFDWSTLLLVGMPVWGVLAVLIVVGVSHLWEAVSRGFGW